MKKKVAWNKNGSLTFAGFARNAETGQTLLLYRDARRGLLATTFEDNDEFSEAGITRNRRFDLIEERGICKPEGAE